MAFAPPPWKVSRANSGAAYEIAAPSRGERRLKLTLTAAHVEITLSGGTPGLVCAIELHLIQDSTGSRLVTWPGNLDWGGSGPPVLSYVATKGDRVYLSTDDGGVTWQGALVGGGYTTPVDPGAPVLSAIPNDGEVALNWTQGAANGALVTTNRIYRGTSSGAETLLAEVAGTTSYTDRTVVNGTTYYYKVTAVNALGEGGQSNEANAKPAVPIAIDDFNRVDATGTTSANGLIGQTTPTGAKTWLNLAGAGTWSVSSNKAVGSASARAGIDAGVSDFTAQVDYDTGGSVTDGGLVIWADASNYIDVIVDSGGYFVQKTVGGSTSNVDNGGGAQTAGVRTIKVVRAGSSVKVYANGVLVVDTTVADAALVAATKVGLFASGSTAGSWDNFSVIP